MSKRVLHKILPIVFLISILFVSFLELNNSMQQMREEYLKEQPKQTEISGEKSQDYNETDIFSSPNTYISTNLASQDEQKSLKNKDGQDTSLSNWKGIERKDSYNNELQFYSTDNVVIKGDTIEITSKKENRVNKMYTSGLVESIYAYKYGYFEFVIDISDGKGIFPAIWFLPENGRGLPEIDLFEMVGSQPDIFYGVIHFQENGVKDSDHFKHKVPIKEQYTVALNWKAESLTWYIDNQEIYTTTWGVPQEYMYLIINQAIGGDWPGKPDDTIFPRQFNVLTNRINSVFKKGRQ